ncbi:uncharacterized peptidase C1-like protein F26E4.3 [Ptychodera flava]|uniref:uncharacterized peptidase C1-like protein F26E4.3 n=1 Tax=Ptychodera flava TaxID=63121 RepID=UPI00396A6B8A
MKLTRIAAIVVLLHTFCVYLTTAQWCSQRSPRCCEGRDDHCTVPYKGIKCYCDIFCNHTVSDCCPDFWPLCLGVDPPEQKDCFHDGVGYREGAVIRVNCNKCTCKNTQGDFAFNCENNACAIRPELMTAVNRADYGWQARNYTGLWGMTLRDAIKYRLGTLQADRTVSQMTEIDMDYNEAEIPDYFDARQKWPGLVHDVMDQGNCGSSWAFSTVGVASDRLAIQSMGDMTMMLSPQHLISCNSRRQRGCEGGHLDRAWWFMRKKGVVSYDCYPYTSGISDRKGYCLIGGKYGNYCPAGRHENNGMYHSSPPYRISAKEKDIQHELMINGPLQASFEVKEDFFMYNKGVYRHTREAAADGPQYHQSGWHSVKIIGWGTEYSPNGRPLKYWLCANSWGSKWGEDGYFKIIRGENECNIESFVLGVWGRMQGVRARPAANVIRQRHNRFRRATDTADGGLSNGWYDWLFGA